MRRLIMVGEEPAFLGGLEAGRREALHQVGRGDEVLRWVTARPLSQEVSA